MLPKNWGEPMGAPAIFEKQIEISWPQSVIISYTLNPVTTANKCHSIKKSLTSKDSFFQKAATSDVNMSGRRTDNRIIIWRPMTIPLSFMTVFFSLKSTAIS
ncbi:MAG: hypothetical protein P8X74_19125 [Reinekea sp.]